MLSPALLDVEYEDLLHRRLTDFNHVRLSPALPDPDWEGAIDETRELLVEEGHFVESERNAVSARAALAPNDPDGFIAWFEDLKNSGPGQGDRLFMWLAETCSLDQMKWFLTQEVAGEAGFEDLTAIAQVKIPFVAKLEMARNYWDEMGRGNPKGMHGPLLHALTVALDLKPRVETTMWESLALGNVMAGLACNRRYAYHAIGALGAIEMTAPGRSAATAAGLRRLGVPAGDRHYFDLHAVLDVKHSQAWNENVLHPLVSQDPRLARAIAEGALMRLQAGARCFARYRRELGC